MTLVKFISINIVVISFLVLLFYKINTKILKNNDFLFFINRTKKLKLKKILIGLIFGIVFGLIDNLGLWIGMTSFQKYIKTDSITQAAIGNTYSDFLGSIIGALISITAQNYINYDNDNEPIWINTIGIVIGCILGLFIGKTFISKV